MLMRSMKPVMLAVAMFAVVWLLVLAYWQSTARMPSTGDVVLWLLALPVALLAGVWGVRKLQTTLAEPVAAPAWVRSSAGAGVTAPRPAPVDEAQFRVSVLASAIRTPGGASAAELLEVLVAGAFVQPDAKLLNDSGFPVFASRIPELDTDDLREQLEALPLATSDGIDVTALADDRLRAMLAMGEALIELLPQAVDAIGIVNPPTEPPTLRISLWLSGLWSEPERLLAAQWVQHLCAAESPQHAWTVDHYRSEVGVSGWTLLDRAALSLNRESRPTRWILLAGESAISEQCVAQWEAQGLLYSPARRHGRMPGEAAAGLLLAGANDARHAGADAVHVTRPAWGQLDAPADGARASNAALLGALAEGLLTRAGVAATEVQWLVSDADHRVSRVTEVAKLLQERFAHVPFDGNNLMTGAACAHMGVAADFVGLALACHLAETHRQPVLVTSLADPLMRAAAIVTMPPPPVITTA